MPSLISLLRPLYHGARAAWLRGNARHCVVCEGSFRRLLPKGDRLDAMCPRCHSLERHRLLWLHLSGREGLDKTGAGGSTPVSLLHFAPEEGIRGKLEGLPGLRYFTADLGKGRAGLMTDITRIGVRAESVDMILCCHVLEHIPDDGAAMRELLRVLKPEGRAVLQVPLRDGPTDEDPAVTDPAERLRRWGLEDHVRLYGKDDFARRLQAAGFQVDIVSATAGMTPTQIERGRLLAEGEHEDILFVARRGVKTIRSD
jgi:SAM-dependent methyltransferase